MRGLITIWCLCKRPKIHKETSCRMHHKATFNFSPLDARCASSSQATDNKKNWYEIWRAIFQKLNHFWNKFLFLIIIKTKAILWLCFFQKKKTKKIGRHEATKFDFSLPQNCIGLQVWYEREKKKEKRPNDKQKWM